MSVYIVSATFARGVENGGSLYACALMARSREEAIAGATVLFVQKYGITTELTGVCIAQISLDFLRKALHATKGGVISPLGSDPPPAA